MIEHLRIGVQIAPNDPFWVQVHETVRKELNNQIIPFEINNHGADLTVSQLDELSEEILSSDLHAMICMILPDSIIRRLLDYNIPVICIEDEIEIDHPFFSSVRGWYDAGKIAARFLVQELAGQGNLLYITGDVNKEDQIDFSRQRVMGIKRALEDFPKIDVQTIQSYWNYDHAVAHLSDGFRSGIIQAPDAILGLSDSIALAAHAATQHCDIINSEMIFVGINGEPSALSEIVKGNLHATVNIRAEDFAGQAVKIAVDAALGKQVARYFYFSPVLVTKKNVAEISIQKLNAISNISTRLVGINRKTEESRLAQYEITSSINRKMAVLSDKQELISSIAESIRSNYDYDRVFFYPVSEEHNGLTLEAPKSRNPKLDANSRDIILEVFETNEPVFVANMRYFDRFQVDDEWPQTQSRVVFPVRFGNRIFGVLDLQSDRPKLQLRNELIGLQIVVDQFGIALHNAALYEQSVLAKGAAEKANQLKTRLLANVSHEFRAPLNVILGYTQALIANPRLYQMDLPEELIRDQRHIFRSGEHLIRLINDLLDVSRAEIGALEIFPVTVAPDSVIQEVFDLFAEQRAETSKVAWKLDMPDELPYIHADVLRLRQILINLLSNAQKFTKLGKITLGAEVEPPYVHIWVQDTGCGISESQQNAIFEPFSSVNQSAQLQNGIGLGLNITRRLVMLHNGKITVESEPGKGSTFNVYFPLPNFVDDLESVSSYDAEKKLMLVISASENPIDPIRNICEKQGLTYCQWQPGQDLEEIIRHHGYPVATALDLSSLERRLLPQVEKIRNDLQLNKIPFLVYSSEEHRNQAKVGVTNVLTKPVTNDSLYDHILAVLPAERDTSILVVDDDPEARNYYIDIITKQLGNVEIITAENGVQALDLLKTAKPSLIILDLMMPVMDGFEVLKNVRLNRKTRKIPIIVMSGKVLTIEDVNRLDFANVVFQSKNLLTQEETSKCLHKVFDDGGFLPQPTSLLVKQCLAYLFQHYTANISREDIADTLGVSPGYLSRIFSEELGITLWECLTRLRMQFAKDMLLDGQARKSITEVASCVGFDDPAYFSKTFKANTGFSPKAFREKFTKL